MIPHKRLLMVGGNGWGLLIIQKHILCRHRYYDDESKIAYSFTDESIMRCTSYFPEKLYITSIL